MVVAALAIERRRIDLARDKQDRDRVGPAFGHAGEGIGRARPGRRADDSGAAGHARVSIGGEGAGLLVANQDGVDRAGPPRDGVVDRRRVRARHAEKMTHTKWPIRHSTRTSAPFLMPVPSDWNYEKMSAS